MSYMKHLDKRPYVIAFAGQKGGIGKTNSAINIADGLCMRGLKVLVLDCDPSPVAKRWSDRREDSGQVSKFPVIRWVGIEKERQSEDVASKELFRDIEAISSGYQIVILDMEGRICPVAVEAVTHSDLVVLPIQPSPSDVDGTKDLVEIIKLRQSILNGRPDACFLINMVFKNTLMEKYIYDSLKEMQLPVLRNRISKYELYKQAWKNGETIFSNGENQPAHELNCVIEELIATYISRSQYVGG